MSSNAVTKKFLLAGKAIFTIEIEPKFAEQNNLKPHYTFKIQFVPARDNHKENYFVSLLTGPNNNLASSYTYWGILNPNNAEIVTTYKSKIKMSSLPFRVLQRTLYRIWADEVSKIEEVGFKLHHEGRCGRCGAPLTTPESCERGIGPDCWKIMHGNFQHISEPGFFGENT